MYCDTADRIEKELKEGIHLCNNINTARSDVRKTNEIINYLADINHGNIDKHIKLHVDSRIYEAKDGLIRYYSKNGVGYYYNVNDFDNIKSFMLRPVKAGRNIKLKEVK